MFERSDLQELKKRMNEPRRFIQVVMGPRQVGKTTMVNQLINQLPIPSMFESADAIAAAGASWLEQIWETARIKINGLLNKEFLLVIDEIQKISNWSEKVKKLWDEDSRNNLPLKVILLGSSRLLLQKGLTESLMGRFETIFMTHWSFTEMQQAFGWDEETYAWFGGYPGSADLINDETRWKKYITDSLIETSISKDILMLTRIDKPVLLKNLFELGCMYSGQILSFTKIMGQLQEAGNTTTLSHYLNLLETAGLLGGLEKYSAAEIRKRSSSPKFQVYNNALLSAQKGLTKNEGRNDPTYWGRVIESCIGAYLVNLSVKNGFTVYYWRDRNDEVDFILEKHNKTIALEIKSNLSKNTSGLNVFKQKFDPHKIYLIENKGLSWKEFLSIHPLDLF